MVTIGRARLLAYLRSELNLNLYGMRRNLGWVKAAFGDLNVGDVVAKQVYYTPENFESLTVCRDQWIALLNTKEITRLSAILDKLEMHEAIITGCCRRLNELSSSKESLTSVQVEMFSENVHRLLEVVSMTPTRIQTLMDLPEGPSWYEPDKELSDRRGELAEGNGHVSK